MHTCTTVKDTPSSHPFSQFACRRSRQMQIKLRQERKGEEKAAASLLAEHWKERNSEIEEEQHREHMDRLNKNKEIRASQEVQIQENRRKKAEMRADDLLRDEQTKAVMMEDDERFRNFAQMEIDRFKAKGKKVSTRTLPKMRRLNNTNPPKTRLRRRSFWKGHGMQKTSSSLRERTSETGEVVRKRVG